jgi:SNF family Na+-dependent transporter
MVAVLKVDKIAGYLYIHLADFVSTRRVSIQISQMGYFFMAISFGVNGMRKVGTCIDKEE